MSTNIGNLFPSGSRVGLGCMGFSWGYSRPGQLDDGKSAETIRRAYEAGVRHFDTSDMYAAGHNEELVGRALADCPDAFVASKGGIVVDSVEPLSMHVDGTREHLTNALERSLRRLNRDHIDLYYLHRLDSEVPVQEQVQVLAEAQQAGKIRHIGVSEATVEQLTAAAEVAQIAAVQSELSVWTRDPLKPQEAVDGAEPLSVLDWCEKHGATLVAFSPLGRGYLTGKLDTSKLMEGDFRTWMPRFTPDAQERNAQIVEALERIADQRGVLASQVALAWVLGLSESTAVIPGSRSLGHIESNRDAGTIQLTSEKMEAITSLPEPVESRY